MMESLYALIVRPVQSLSAYPKKIPLRVSFFVLFCVAVSVVAQSNFGGDHVLFGVLIAFCLYSLFLFFQVVSMDFIAQLWGYKAQSLRLFSWLSVSLLPLCLNVPVYLLYVSLPATWNYGLALMELLIGGMVIGWQLVMIKRCYKTTRWHCFFIYTLPIIFLVSIVMIVFMAAFSFQW